MKKNIQATSKNDSYLNLKISSHPNSIWSQSIISNVNQKGFFKDVMCEENFNFEKMVEI